MYVALRRVTTLDSLYILGTFTANAIRTNPLTLAKYNRIRTESILKDVN